MKKFLLGFVSGVAAVIMALALWRYIAFQRVEDDLQLFEIAPQVVESSLPGANVLDVSVSPDSKRTVNYVWDSLYDVNVTYRRLGKVKRIVLTFGKYGDRWITPNVTDVVILDDKAEVVHTLSGDAP